MDKHCITEEDEVWGGEGRGDNSPWDIPPKDIF